MAFQISINYYLNKLKNLIPQSHLACPKWVSVHTCRQHKYSTFPSLFCWTALGWGVTVGRDSVVRWPVSCNLGGHQGKWRWEDSWGWKRLKGGVKDNSLLLTCLKLLLKREMSSGWFWCFLFLVSKRQLTPIFLAGKSHEERSLVGYGPWSCKRVRHDSVTKPQTTVSITSVS